MRCEFYVEKKYLGAALEEKEREYDAAHQHIVRVLASKEPKLNAWHVTIITEATGLPAEVH